MVGGDNYGRVAWGEEPGAGVVVKLHVRHDDAGLAAAADSFRALIDLALARGGSYYLTYHRWAPRGQVEAAHPRFAEFLRAKREFDPAGRWSSDWYRHHCRPLHAVPASAARHRSAQRSVWSVWVSTGRSRW